jgi:hypothetical protein
MRILAAADLHGNPRHLTTIQNALSEVPVDMVVLAGDILNYRRRRSLLSRLDELSVPVLVVRGNSDPAYLERWAATSRNVRSLHLSPFSFGDVDLVGVSGTLPIPFHSRAGWHEARTLKTLAPLLHTRAILVAHPPPRGCCDRVLGRFHAGSRGLSRLIQETSPMVMICGHIHEAAGVDRMGDTLVVNCALGPRHHGAAIVLEDGRPPSAVML